MSDTKTASWIAALERARAELEGALSVDAHWRAPRGAPGDAHGADHKKALATNPVYRCWAQLNEAIEELRKAQVEPAAVRRRISLRDVLEQIHSDAALAPSGEPQAGSVAADWPELQGNSTSKVGEDGAAASPPPLWGRDRVGGNPRPQMSEFPPPLTPPHKGEGNPVVPARRDRLMRGESADAGSQISGNLAPEPEEATVSFVIREPARSAAGAEHGGEASGPKPPPATPKADPTAEAEVVIVRRRR